MATAPGPAGRLLATGRADRGRDRPARRDPSVVLEGTCRRRRAIVLRESCESRPAAVPASASRSGVTFRKEVIQPQVPLRLPCYDFTPVADPTVDACLPCGLAQRLRVEPTPMV